MLSEDIHMEYFAFHPLTFLSFRSSDLLKARLRPDMDAGGRENHGYGPRETHEPGSRRMIGAVVNLRSLLGFHQNSVLVSL